MKIGRVTILSNYSILRVWVPVAVSMDRRRLRRNLDGSDLEFRAVGRPVRAIGHQIVGAGLRMMKRGVHHPRLDALGQQRPQARLTAARAHLEPIAVADAAQFSVTRMYLEAIFRMHSSIQRAPRLGTNIVLTEYSASSQYQRIL